MLSEQRIVKLIFRSLAKEATEGELKQLRDYMDASPANLQRVKELTDVHIVKKRLRSYYDSVSDEDAAWSRIQRMMADGAGPLVVVATPRKSLKWIISYTAVAAAIIAAAVLIFQLAGKQSTPDTIKPPIAQTLNDVAPGGNRAVLTLASGQAIVLDSVHTGLVAQQGATHVSKTGSGELAYKSAEGASEADAAPVFNTLSTPRGGQYQLVLPDGSKVWLNAASSIRYPVAFTGAERRVFITGEAYFEIAHVTRNGSRVPFIVSNGDNEVAVLGTHFNVNTYDDEDVLKVTLLEGAVKVSNLTTSDSRLIRPGQQAQVTRNNHLEVVPDANLEEVMAWKNGNFQFDGTSIEAVMRQLARWYNVQVQFAGPIEGELGGRIPRSATLSTVLTALEATGKARFNITGKTVTVSPVH